MSILDNFARLHAPESIIIEKGVLRSFVMQHRSLRYTIRMGIEPDVWMVSIFSGDTESAAKRLYGTREDAEREARSMMGRWVQNRRKQSQLKTKDDNEQK